MLVLGRKLGESFWIGEDILITILRSQKGYIRIGISAPKNIKILREELIEKDKNKPCNPA